MDTINKLKENVAIILPEKGLEEKLQEVSKENRKLIIKLGFDPTAPDLHLGHAVVLKKLREFQDLGHHIIILVGSFTAKIGDPTGKNKSRKPLSTKEVQYNSETYLQQLAKIIELSKAEIVYNSEWLETRSFSDVIQLLSKVTVAQLMHRNDFNKRFTENTPIAMHELVYPILQGYDSVKIKADIEMGGTDQLFNCTMGRQIQQSFNMSPQIIMCMPLLRGLDGKEKMSKSLNNTIGLTDEPTDIFGKTMSISDDLIPEFLKLTTDFSVLEKQAILKRLSTGENPMEIKKIIAKNIIKQYYNEQAAKDAELFFINQFQSKKAENKAYHPVSLKSIQAKENIITLTNLCSFLKNDLTKSAIKRLIISGAIQVNSQKITDPQTNISLIKEMKIKIGKRSFYELK
ncbi:tyrosine--tRNA ligase [Tenacibaculum piscium]|uniref:Tyrosine--tRNA ligase n=1 Tax=Tenacibaculum piscium TaxID=1458515 RepID=A0A2H1YFF8_9FLAO|nr:tyrosine--tRNA ligase [Tenacibaculum piscium]MBE7629074.1 tyrosine--tRNA ligase [Tenacibaculum piscium]MBE7684905.1 tyrosine--tRNA ligase [Tenacibaculum piscium]MBE7689608.1 tyrosine--tRNA ligase [Tenacibaculum piscium]SOS74234.1 Tyrosine--tRNA ligase 2 [Tenacibaculum piscium]